MFLEWGDVPVGKKPEEFVKESPHDKKEPKAGEGEKEKKREPF